MNEKQRIARRLTARAQGRAVLVRESSDLAPDASVTLGIITIKIVTEEHVQAIAFGDFVGAPEVIARVDPLGRDASDLEPFAAWLISRFEEAERQGALPRIWLPHLQTLETLDVLGYRYERNASASETLQRMGQICRILAREFRHPGQQLVAIGAQLLTDHVVTGQSPAEDGHLGALLAWIDPPVGGSALELARLRSIQPASGVLANYPGRRDDERIEHLRRLWKKATGSTRARAEREIGNILRRAALDEWALLDDARRAFWSLPLIPGALVECVEQTRTRLLYALQYGPHVPKNAVPRMRELTVLEDSQTKLANAQMNGDALVRFEAQRKGRCLIGNVIAVGQPKANRKPCVLTIASPQRELRLRPDDRLVAAGTNVEGKVVAVTYDAVSGGSNVTLDITNGVRSISEMVSRAAPVEWIPCSAFPLALKLKALSGVSAPWMLDENGAAPSTTVGRKSGADLLQIAENHLGGATR